MAEPTPIKLTPGPAYTDGTGKRHDDGLHDAMLANGKGDKFVQGQAVRRALKRGVAPGTVRACYTGKK